MFVLVLRDRAVFVAGVPHRDRDRRVVVIAMVVLYQLSPLYVVYAIGTAGMIWLFHLDNIQRLLNGTERRIELHR